jgi:hypothetical protein
VGSFPRRWGSGLPETRRDGFQLPQVVAAAVEAVNHVVVAQVFAGWPDNEEMKVAAASTTSSGASTPSVASTPNSGTTVAQLQKDLQDLEKSLRDENNSKTDDAKTKAAKVKQLEDEIQQVQIEIQQAQVKAAQKNAKTKGANGTKNQTGTTGSNQPATQSPPAPNYLLDVTA